MPDRRVIAGAAVAASVLLAGCSGDGQATQSSAPTPTTAVSTAPPPTSTKPALPTHGAPKVAVPLDATRLLADPCAALSPQTIQTLDMAPAGKPDLDGIGGPNCEWGGASLRLTFMKVNANGLSDYYRGRQAGEFPGRWDETFVGGYPGVFKDGGTHSDSDGACNLTIGLSDTLPALISLLGVRGPGKCDASAVRVAEGLISTLKGGR
ncbi:DUF3558 family protein [Herbihabitans rhizosphaerae]|uniref:DUF3558 family protein n=1 Tax=Herbihabitans rhizosphaerae TaxID=1872711 RepID=UPI003BF7E21C